MGLKDILFYDLSKFSNVAFRWSEPLQYRNRLRGDIFLRVLICLGVWAASTGLLLCLFSTTASPITLKVAVGLGTIGMGVAMCMVFMGKNHAGGNFWIRPERIERARRYVSLASFGNWTQYTEWPYAAIRRCELVTSKSTGKSFSVMLLHSTGEAEIVGIPKKINLPKLVAFLNAKGVQVQTRNSAPEHFTRPLHLAFPAAAVAAGVVVLGVGLSVYGKAEARRDQVAENRKEFNKPQVPEIPDVPVPARPVLPFNGAAQTAEDDQQLVPQDFEKPGEDSKPKGAPSGIPRNIGPSMIPPSSGTPRPGGPQGIRPGLGAGNRPGPRFGSRPSPGGIRPGGSQPGSDVPGPDQRPSVNPRSIPPRAVRSRELDPDAQLAGGPGGQPFRSVAPNKEPVLGFYHRMSKWRGKAALIRFEPIFTYKPRPRGQEPIVAKQGYAVGGLNAVSGDFINAVQVIFLRVQKDGNLDPTDNYTSEWIGELGEEKSEKLGGAGAKVIGIQGRRVAVIDAIGLVYE